MEVTKHRVEPYGRHGAVWFKHGGSTQSSWLWQERKCHHGHLDYLDMAQSALASTMPLALGVPRASNALTTDESHVAMAAPWHGHTLQPVGQRALVRGLNYSHCVRLGVICISC